jgi:hypothetical protein
MVYARDTAASPSHRVLSNGVTAGVPAEGRRIG